MKSEFRIRIFQPLVPEYRVALFEGLGQRYGDRIEVWAGDGFGEDQSLPLKGIKFSYGHNFVSIGPFKWQKGLSLAGLESGDVIVICGDIHQLSSLWLGLCAKIRGVRVIWWGHHKTSTSKAIGVWLRLKFAKVISDAYLCYTKAGVEFLVRRGFSECGVFATGNTIDQNPIRDAINNWSDDSIAKFQSAQRIDGKDVLLVCGVLRPKMKLDQLIAAMAEDQLCKKDVVLAVIGDGPQRGEYERKAKDFGVSERIIWVGATRDQGAMAPWFLSAKMFVYPGAIGLGILHAFSYGLPVVTHGNAGHQMPEFEVMDAGKTGLTFEEDDIKDLCEKIAFLLEHEDERQRMGRQAKDLAYSECTMSKMIENFSRTIEWTARQGCRRNGE